MTLLQWTLLLESLLNVPVTSTGGSLCYALYVHEAARYRVAFNQEFHWKPSQRPKESHSREAGLATADYEFIRWKINTLKEKRATNLTFTMNHHWSPLVGTEVGRRGIRIERESADHPELDFNRRYCQWNLKKGTTDWEGINTERSRMSLTISVINLCLFPHREHFFWN